MIDDQFYSNSINTSIHQELDDKVVQAIDPLPFQSKYMFYVDNSFELNEARFPQ